MELSHIRFVLFAIITSPNINMFERPPPHSIQAISAKRAGGKKVPKKYRKYHATQTKKSKKTGGHIATKVFTVIQKVISTAVNGV